MRTLYIYELPFNGRCKNTINYGKVDYTGPETRTEDGFNVKIEFLNQLTFEEYNAQNGGNLKTATETEFFKMLRQYEDQKIITEFSEITEDRFFEMLEVLPPAKWQTVDGLETFFVSECYTSNIYSFYLHDKVNKKYFTALRRINETSENLQKSYFNFINQ